MGRGGGTHNGVDCSGKASWALSSHYRLIADIDIDANMIKGLGGRRDGGTGACTAFNGTSTWLGNLTNGSTCTGWKPIGDDSNRFTGGFDGDGHVIRNLYSNQHNDSGNSNAGLFGYVSGGSIENVGVEAIHIHAFSSSYTSPNSGGLVGRMSGGSISNSYATGAVSSSYSSSSYSETSNSGGLVGRMSRGSISNSYATGGVSSSSSAYSDTGGLVGSMSGSRISNSYATGGVSSTGSGSSSVSNSGGLVGSINNNGSMSGSSISNSYATGVVSSSAGGDSYSGGLVGSIVDANGSIENSYATGAVSSTASGYFSSSNSGGLVGGWHYRVALVYRIATRRGLVLLLVLVVLLLLIQAGW